MKRTQEQANAISAQARRCAAELKEALQVKPKQGWNKVVPPILRKHYEMVKPFGISLIEFNSIIGRQNRRFGVRT